MAAPGAPQNVRLVRLGDRDCRVEWDKVPGATSYGLRYRRGTQAGFGDSKQGWHAATTGTSFTMRRWSANSGFQLVVYATNKDGNSVYSAPTPWFYTPPTPAQALTAKTQYDPAGNPLGVQLGFKLTGYYQSGLEVERSNGTVFQIGSGTSGLVKAPYLDTGIGGPVAYRVRPFVGAASPAGLRVYGAWTGPTATVNAGYRPPLAPTVNAPLGAASGTVIKVPVQHNPADGSPQTSLELRHRKEGTSTWSTVAVSGTQAYANIPAQTVGTVEVQARTRGNTQADWSDWSALRVIGVIAAQVVTISKPGSTYPSNVLDVEWAVSQAAGLPQSAWTVTVRQASTVLGQVAGVGATTKAGVGGVDLANGGSYSVTVASTVAGLTVEKTQAFAVVYTPPATPILTVVWDEDAGRHLVTAGPGTGGSVTTTSLRLERSLDGDSWVELLDGFAEETTISDVDGRSAGATWYQLTATGSNTATAQTVVESVTRSPALWVYGGDDQAAYAKLSYDLSWSPRLSKPHSELVWLDGDDKPTIIEDRPISVAEEWAISGSLAPIWEESEDADADRMAVQALHDLFRNYPVVMVKTPDGRVLTGSLRGLDIGSGVSLGSVSFTIEEAR